MVPFFVEKILEVLILPLFDFLSIQLTVNINSVGKSKKKKIIFTLVKGWKPKPRPYPEPTMPRTIPQSDIPKLHKPKWYIELLRSFKVG